MANTIIGKIHEIGPAQTFTSRDGRGFVKRELVLDATRFDPYTGEQGTPDFPVLEFTGDRVRDLDGFRPGEVVQVSFALHGQRYTDKDGRERSFNSVRGYRIERRANPAQTQAAAPQAAPQQQPIQPRQPMGQQQAQYYAAGQDQGSGYRNAVLQAAREAIGEAPAPAPYDEIPF
ncbi:MAG: DUF3127 domain-containing protein [Prevotellaceae bacterium]|nr:DUF3127 domain-containing protein [Prevotellaceae bacterium]